MEGHCSKCLKVWTQETRQGYCHWCGEWANCQTLAEPRIIKPSHRHRTRQDFNYDEGYNQLEGEWRDWLEVARRYEGKVPSQDRYDIRHSIIIELHRARQRDCQPLPQLRAYRIASLTVALYWRESLRYQVRVCLYNGLPVEPHCKVCSHQPAVKPCPYLATRPIQSLESDIEGGSGDVMRLKDTIADDNAIDLDLQIDASTWLLGCPVRLVEIATKKLDGKALTAKDRMYLSRYRQQTQKSLF